MISATYDILGPDAHARAEAVAVEQSHELPTELAPDSARRSLASVTQSTPIEGGVRATIDYPDDLAGNELAQLLVLLIGNVSLQEGVRLIDVDLPDALIEAVGSGPRLGVDGVRRLVGAASRPLLATAIKPVGLDVDELASLTYDLAAGGIDVVKEDQGLGDQAWAPFADRVPRLAEAVARANADTGGSAVYLPTVASSGARLEERLQIAIDAGAGGALVLPGIAGFDQIALAADILGPDRMTLAHPSFLGGFTASATHGIAPELLFGTLLRLAGADAVIFPSYGGRFSFTREQCVGIAERSRARLGTARASLPAPGGGMSVERTPELVQAYGSDVLLLIGSDLHRGGDVRGNAARLREAVESI